MDVSKLKFDIYISYNCDEGEGCDATLENGTYEQVVKLVQDLDSRTYITGYYHYMSIDQFDVYDENGELLDFSTILDGDYEWIQEYYTSDKDEATEIPENLLKFLEDLKNGDEGKRAREVEEIKTQIDKLKKELKEAEEKLSKLEEKKGCKMTELMLPDDNDYVLCGYRGTKPAFADIVYAPYIPKQIVETDEEREARVKRCRAGKSYAKVKLSNSNPRYRCKRGEIVDRDPLNKKVCLEIETWNTCTESGHMTWVAVLGSRYNKKIWFDEDELENFESYDENGDLMK